MKTLTAYELLGYYKNPHFLGFILFNNYKSFVINFLINMLIDNGFNIDGKISDIYLALNINEEYL